MNLIVTTPEELERIVDKAVQKALHKKRLLTRQEAAEHFSCSIGLIDKMIKEGELEVKRIGRRVAVKI